MKYKARVDTLYVMSDKWAFIPGPALSAPLLFTKLFLT